MKSSSFQAHTQFIFIASKLLNSPLGVMFSLLAFILCKSLNATPLQLTILVSLKPIVAIVSFYSVLIVKNKPHNLKKLIICSTILGFLPCLLFPFVDFNWFFIFSSTCFMLAARAMLPAWTEVFKLNILSDQRGKIFSRGSTINYLANIIIPLIVAPIMDYCQESWKWIFFILGTIQLLHILFLLRLHVNTPTISPDYDHEERPSYRSIFLQPWKSSWNLLKKRPDFKGYQVAFLFGGAGLILVQPVLPIFFEKILQLSYTQLAFAISLCKGIGFTLASPVWARWFDRISIHLFNSLVTGFAGLFAIILLSMQQEVNLIYFAYLIYGIMQAGSELSWHLAGPKFSEEKDSTLFTSVNVAMVGLRGCIAPFLGEFLFIYSGLFAVFSCSAILCFTGSLYSLSLNRKNQATRANHKPITSSPFA
jgi:MFS family permease